MIRIAISQFSTTGDFRLNAHRMSGQIAEAAAQGALLVHFPEACLSGYAGSDLEDYSEYDWAGLRQSATGITECARRNAIWVVFGSAHPLSDGHKPHNSLYVVNSDGDIVDRYDKRFCAGNEAASEGDLAHYSPGDHFCGFTAFGAKFGTLICHEYRYPELYREHAQRGTQILLHSFHAGAVLPERFTEIRNVVGAENQTINPADTIAGITQIAATHAAASSNNLWISCSNSSAPKSCWGAFIVRPDGVCVGRLERDVDGLLICDIDLGKAYYDSTKSWRARAMNGQFHSGGLVDDPRSAKRQSF